MFDMDQMVTATGGGAGAGNGGTFQGWSDMLQGAAAKWAGSAIDNRYNQQFQLQKMAMTQYGPGGVPYIEGQPNGQQPVVNVQGSIPQSWLIIGVIVAAVVFLGD
jgi:hypothetical protein